VGESCEDCDRPYADTIWHASDALWYGLVSPEGRGLLCPRCFGKRAKQAGVRVIFCAVPEAEAVIDGRWSPVIFPSDD
jgi:hypothetical protein